MALACASGESERGAAPVARPPAARDVVLVSIDARRATRCS
jgi:hypothetical protein